MFTPLQRRLSVRRSPILVALVCLGWHTATPLAGQTASDVPTGLTLTIGATLAKPFLDDDANLPFDQVGSFRPGTGLRVGAGYRYRSVELMGTADFAGLGVGEPFERNGIPMGRRTSILRSFAVSVWWEPGGLARWGWSPRAGVGLVTGSVDNVSVNLTELPADLAAQAASVTSVSASKAVGVGGRGVRIGVGAERSVGSSWTLGLRLETDVMRYSSFIVREERFALATEGHGWVPRLVVAGVWSP